MDILTYVKVKLLLSPRQSRGFTCFNYTSARIRFLGASSMALLARKTT